MFLGFCAAIEAQEEAVVSHRKQIELLQGDMRKLRRFNYFSDFELISKLN